MPEKPLRIINAPFDLCGRRVGSRLGPAAARLAGLKREIKDLGVQIDSKEGGWDLELDTPDMGASPAEKAEAVAGLARSKHSILKESVSQAIADGKTPLVVGGDHSLSVGSVSAALEAYGDKLGVIWIDAHMDVNTPDVSLTKNIHGMPLAALLRLREEGFEGVLSTFWAELLREVVPRPGLHPSRLCWFGIREVDDAEKSAWEALGKPLALTMDDIDRGSIAGCVEEVRKWVDESGMTALWISFDVDSIDPMYAPGTGTTVRGGLTFREGHFLAEALHHLAVGPNAKIPLAGIDLVEINPILDRENATARMAVGWLTSLFGKSILR